MPKAAPLQSNFITGEISPLSQGRVDLDRYKAALATCLNYVPTQQGGLTRRSGSAYIAPTKTATGNLRLVPFKFAEDDSFMLEFSDNLIRFFTEHALVQTDAGATYELATPYDTADIPLLTFNQSADVLYICHPSYKPRKLQRFSNNQWRLDKLTLDEGPFEYDKIAAVFSISSLAVGSRTLTATPLYPLNVTAIATSGGLFKVTTDGLYGSPGTVDAEYRAWTKVRIIYSVGDNAAQGDWDIVWTSATQFTLTGSTFSGTFNYGAGDRALIFIQVFQTTDIGRYLQIGDLDSDTDNTRSRALITARTNSHQVTVSLLEAIEDSTAAVGYYTWFDLFYDGNGPKASCFHEDRLVFIGAPSAPQRIDGSQTGNYEDFSVVVPGTPEASDAVSFVLNSNDVNLGKWLFSDEKGLLSGTLASEWVVKSASSTEPLGPVSIDAKQVSKIGSSDCYPVQVGKAVLFVQKSGKRIREFHYFYDVDGYRATDLTLLADHIGLSGFRELAAQTDPQQVIWGCLEDGTLAALTYERDLDNIRAGWHRHEIAGTVEGQVPVVESVAVVPSPDGTEDEVWMIVRRKINGTEVCYVEYLLPQFDASYDLYEGCFLDCSLTYDSPKTITAITKANPAVVTSASHGFSNGNTVILRDIVGMTELNDLVFTVANVAANTFELSGINSSSYTTYQSGGTARKRVSTITGLSHLEGESVKVVGDGSVLENEIVSSGSITISKPSGTVHIGYNYNSDMQLPRLEAGSANGTSIGKTRRMHRVGVMLYRSVNLLIGPDFDNMDRIPFRDSNVLVGQPTPLFTGIKSETVDFDYDFENQVCIRQDLPLPSTIIAVMPQMDTQDRE